MVKGHTQTLWVLMLEDRFSRLSSNLRFGGNKKELKSELKRVCSFQHLTSERQSIRFRLSLCYCHQWNIQLCIIHIRVEITQYLQNTTQIIWANQRREKKLGLRTDELHMRGRLTMRRILPLWLIRRRETRKDGRISRWTTSDPELRSRRISRDQSCFCAVGNKTERFLEIFLLFMWRINWEAAEFSKFEIKTGSLKYKMSSDRIQEVLLPGIKPCGRSSSS